jgi:hypothetical protein
MAGMTRREIVILVSRAIAILQFIEALMFSFFSLPPAILSFHNFILRMRIPDSFRPQFDTLRETQILLMLGRIAAQLFIAWIFWNCGPFIERKLAPKVEDSN